MVFNVVLLISTWNKDFFMYQGTAGGDAGKVRNLTAWTGRGGFVCKMRVDLVFPATLSFGTFLCVSKEKYKNNACPEIDYDQ
jgi:hypothetical protein